MPVSTCAMYPNTTITLADIKAHLQKVADEIERITGKAPVIDTDETGVILSYQGTDLTRWISADEMRYNHGYRTSASGILFFRVAKDGYYRKNFRVRKDGTMRYAEIAGLLLYRLDQLAAEQKVAARRRANAPAKEEVEKYLSANSDSLPTYSPSVSVTSLEDRPVALRFSETFQVTPKTAKRLIGLWSQMADAAREN